MEDNRIETNEIIQIDLFEIIEDCMKRIRQIWWILLLIICICVVSNVWKEKKYYNDQYEASASFIVTTGGNISSYYNKLTMEQLNSTFPYILTSGILHNIVAEDLEMSTVPGTISASVLEETNLFQIKVVSSEPQMAYDILQSVIENYPAVAKYVIGDTVMTLIDESGVPESPMYAPSYASVASKGFLFGTVICAVILVLLVLMRKTVKSQNDIKAFMNVKYIAGIPKERVKKRSKKKNSRVMLDNETASPVFKESLHTFQIRFTRIMEEKKYKVIVVTSALAGEGKTTVSCNLAYAMANKGYKVLLIDGDFRNPSVAETLDLPVSDYGVADALKGDIDAEKVIQQYKDLKLWVLPGAKPQERVSKLYRNGRLRDLIEKYSEQMDYIIIDTPPCGIMNDAALAADNADASLLVIRQDFARRDKIMEGVEMLSSSAADLIGCVINGEEVSGGAYGRYGYGKYGYGRYGYGRYGYGYRERTRK